MSLRRLVVVGNTNWWFAECTGADDELELERRSVVDFVLTEMSRMIPHDGPEMR